MHDNVYSRAAGDAPYQLDRSLIDAKWGQADGCGDAIDLINKVFEIYFNARRLIDIMYRRDVKLASAMETLLEDVSTSGSGGGVSDLNEAFQHLDANGGRWLDDNTRAYLGNGVRYSIYRADVHFAPEAGAHFLNALNKRLEKLSGILEDYRQVETKLENAYDGGSAWTEIRELGEEAEDLAEQAGRFLWIVPDRITEAEWFTKVARTLDGVDKCFGAFKKVDQLISGYVDMRAAGMPPGVAVAWTTIGEAMGYLPVLGDLYGSIVQNTPGLIRSVRELGHERARKPNLVGPY